MKNTIIAILTALIGTLRFHKDCVTLDPGPEYDVELVVLTVPSKAVTNLPLVEIVT